MDSSKLVLIKDSFQKGETDEFVDGITVIIDGKVKEVFDLIIQKNKKYNDYTEVLRDAIFEGVNNIIKSTK